MDPAVLLERPLIYFLAGGVATAVLALVSLRDAVRKWQAERSAPAEPTESDESDEPVEPIEPIEPTRARGPGHAIGPNLRFAGSLAVIGLLAFFSFQLLASVARMAPALSEIQALVGSPAPDWTYLALDRPEASPEATAPGATAPEATALEAIALETIALETIALETTSASPRPARLADLRGRVVLLNVWATWCPPCRAEMPELDRLQREKGVEGVTVLHLSMEPVATLRAWREEHPMSTSHGKIESLPFTIPALPTSLVIDRRGIVRDVMLGGRDFEAFRDAVEPWL